jgi:hypothetical protein
LNRKTVAAEVAEFRSRFQQMRYCLDPEQTLRIAPPILASIFPARDTFRRFTEALHAI